MNRLSSAYAAGGPRRRAVRPRELPGRQAGDEGPGRQVALYPPSPKPSSASANSRTPTSCPSHPYTTSGASLLTPSRWLAWWCRCGAGWAMAATVRLGELLVGHVGLDIESLDRIYLNGHIPTLRGSVTRWSGFMMRHLGYEIPRRRSWRRSAPVSAGRWLRSLRPTGSRS